MNTTDNGQITALVDRYIAMWNETDPARRRALIAGVWVDGATYLDPVFSGEGRNDIDAMVMAVHEKYPGHRFTRTSDVNAHHDRAQFAWQLGPKGGAALVKGIDFATLSADGRLESVTGFFTEVAAAAA
jgi:hypothetical protein